MLQVLRPALGQLHAWRDGSGTHRCVDIAEVQRLGERASEYFNDSDRRIRARPHPNISNPFTFTIDSNFLAAPLGRLSPRSHLLTRLVVTLR